MHAAQVAFAFGVIFAVAGIWAIYYTRERVVFDDIEARIFAMSASIFIFTLGCELILVSVIFLVFG